MQNIAAYSRRNTQFASFVQAISCSLQDDFKTSPSWRESNGEFRGSPIAS
jgi:hypothetical protein